MFYSKFLLSNKEAYNTIWSAAHGHKNLRKDQIQKTDISASVDEFKNDEILVMSHRVLAFLLLGVVRIHSRKADYLYQDCQDVVKKLVEFIAGKSTGEGSGASRIRDKIITFSKELELTGVSGTCHSSEIILPQRFELDAFDLGVAEDLDFRNGNIRLGKEPMLADGLLQEGSASGLPYMEKMSAGATAHKTPPRDSFLEECLEPLLLDEAEEEQLNFLCDGNPRLLEWPTDDMEIDSETNSEMPNEIGYSSDPSLDSMLIESEKVQGGNEDAVEVQPLNMTMALTPDTKFAGGEVATSRVVTIPTPVLDDHETMKVSPIKYKNWIQDSTDLRRKRRRVSYSSLDVWKANRHNDMTAGVLEHRIPMDLPTEHEKMIFNVRSPETDGVDHMPHLMKPIITPSRDQILISKGTSVSHSSSHEFEGVAEPDDPTSSAESLERAPPSGGMELDNIFGNEISLPEEHSLEIVPDNTVSERGRISGQCLHEHLLQRKGGTEDEALNFSQIVQGKTKTESSRLFYDLLVLKTQGHLDVQQDEAYGDILLHETSKSKPTLELEPES